ncbi:MAG: hypothetical protein WAN65_14640, partial [Candidatus Sulfotelmatobacter sp.]
GTMAFGNDQQKAEKRLRRISAMAVESAAARAIVNQTIAEVVHAQRMELMRQRHAMNLSYGSLFIAHQLTAAGATMLDIAVQLQSGKDIVQIANERNANWKLVGDATKQLNDKIDDNIYRHFLHLKAEQELTAAEKYDPRTDVVRADQDVTPEEVANARADYDCWKNRGSAPEAGRLNTKAERELGASADIYKGGERPHPF